MTPQQARLLTFIARYQQRNKGVSPTLREMKLGLGIRSHSGARRVLDQLRSRGLIRRGVGAHRSVEIVMVRAPYLQGQTMAKDFDDLTLAEIASVRERYDEGFDTLEIRDQIVGERLLSGRPAMISEAQVYNELGARRWRKSS